MRFILRYDDFGPSPIPEYYDIENALFDLFFQLKIPMVVGAVPLMPDDAFDPKNEKFYALTEDDARIELMKQALSKGFQLALHGYKHQVMEPTVLSEFAGQPKATQRQKIQDGVATLERCFNGTEVDIFIPPWNTHDDTTTDVVGELGLHQLSAGDNATLHEKGGVVVSPSYPIGSFVDYLQFYSLGELEELVGNGTFVLTFHAYQFWESHPQFALTVDEFGVMLRNVLGQGYPVVQLDSGTGTEDMKMASERKLANRFGLFAKSHTKIGRSIIGLAHQIRKRFGINAGQFTIDIGATLLMTLLRMYRK